MSTKKYICKYCGKEFDSPQKLGGHVSRCKNNPNYSVYIKTIKSTKNKNNPIKKYECICKICGKKYILYLKQNDFIKGKYKKTCSITCAHKLSTKNTDWSTTSKHISEKSKHIAWNKGKIFKNGKWVNNEKINSICICPICNKEYLYNGKKYCSLECSNIGRKQNISKALKNNPNSGGLRPNAYKKYKSGLYHGIHCDSSWELAFVIYCEEHNICIKRNKKYLIYTYKNKEYKYYPDFVIDNQLYEIKGYENDKALSKHAQHPEVIYLDKYKMKPYINYVINKYGKDFIKLYDRLDKQIE